jgi:hypothetical protein
MKAASLCNYHTTLRSGRLAREAPHLNYSLTVDRGGGIPRSNYGPPSTDRTEGRSKPVIPGAFPSLPSLRHGGHTLKSPPSLPFGICIGSSLHIGTSPSVVQTAELRMVARFLARLTDALYLLPEAGQRGL